ncbi:MAG: Adenine DNA glycosylase [Chroococcidiopsis sp. SAG 2025]|uniref:A/G-specific adenine glycosylase n=1 Tax=Chroococcidiopsis sp. SAG 2025 TaxID=171389 RepID=UPI0029372F7B|nr:A/G-specific adenine glycosylase [Chroococcidiopsis sp. SAG 2025]MDV2995254.1 Adenine DNA glycosylase [Chroococcidiopsis sp. SAG 2025]
MTSATAQSQENFTSLLAANKIKGFRRQLTSWATLNLREFPWRNTTDAYAIFIAEFLLQKTSANTVAPIYADFLTRYPTLKDLATASVEEIAILLKPLGLHFRADRLYQSVQVIIEQYDGKIPASEAQLLSLPGIGLYTARSICANAFAQPLAILDTNVARILERFFGLQGNRVKSRCKLLWSAAEYVAPKTNVSRWNLTLLDFGAGVCTARNPSCGICPLRSQCNYAKIKHSA